MCACSLTLVFGRSFSTIFLSASSRNSAGICKGGIWCVLNAPAPLSASNTIAWTL
jgi:hypothetical protein